MTKTEESTSETIVSFLVKASQSKWIWLAPLTIFLISFFYLPLVYMFIYSFFSMEGYTTIYVFTLKNYYNIFFDPQHIYFILLAKTFIFSGVVTFICLTVSYPCAYYIVKEVKRTENKLLLTLLFAIPFFAGEIIRVLTVAHFLGPKGMINRLLDGIGLPALEFINYTNYSVIITLIYAQVAFMAIAIYLSLLNLDFNLIDVAKSYGASSFRAFKEITWPLSSPGVFVGVIVIFVPTCAHYLSPTFVGGPDSAMYGNIVVHQFQAAAAWTIGSALAIVLVMFALIIVLIFYKTIVRVKGGFWV